MPSWLELGPAPAVTRPATRLRPASVLGLGTALPPTSVPNDVVARRLGVEDGWIERRTGIEARRRLADGETLVDLAARAATAALRDAQVDALDLDLVVAATTGSDDVLPNLAPLVAGTIGAHGAGGFDVGLACTGFVAALGAGAAAIESGRADRVLVLGADAMTQFLDQDDPVTGALFGDGAGAVVLGTDGDGHVGPVRLGSDASRAGVVGIPRASGRVVIDGHGTYVEAVRRLEQATREAVGAAGLLLDELDLLVFHQANRRILRSLTERLGVPVHRVVDAIAPTGNTSSASLPLALEHARTGGQLKPGSRVLLGGVGAGFAWGAAVVTWGQSPHHDTSATWSRGLS